MMEIRDTRKNPNPAFVTFDDLVPGDVFETLGGRLLFKARGQPHSYWAVSLVSGEAMRFESSEEVFFPARCRLEILEG